VFFYEASNLETERKIISKRKHSALIGAKASQQTDGTFLRQVVQELKASRDKDIVKLGLQVAQRLGEPVEYWSWLLKTLSLPSSFGVEGNFKYTLLMCDK